MTTGKGPDVDLLVAIISHAQADWRTVALCGRAMAATGRLNSWMIDAGKPDNDVGDLSQVLLAFGDATERIPELWNSFLSSGDVTTFQAELASIVSTMEGAIPGA